MDAVLKAAGVGPFSELPDMVQQLASSLACRWAGAEDRGAAVVRADQAGVAVAGVAETGSSSSSSSSSSSAAVRAIASTAVERHDELLSRSTLAARASAWTASVQARVQSVPVISATSVDAVRALKQDALEYVAGRPADGEAEFLVAKQQQYTAEADEGAVDAALGYEAGERLHVLTVKLARAVMEREKALQEARDRLRALRGLPPSLPLAKTRLLEAQSELNQLDERLVGNVGRLDV
jgi:hypothetical protein